LGFAIVSAVGLLVATRLRRADARTGWLVAVGGAFLTSAVLFSAASGIFHPYYVSLLAPFTAALVGVGAAELMAGSARAGIFAPLALAAGAAGELAVLHQYPGQLSWLPPLLLVTCIAAGLVLILLRSQRARLAAVTAALV
jgi:4-amino-4-deoxy-L-arabinose transferase-like glycosyltransferase